MRTFNVVVSLGLIGLALGLPPAASFDGVPEAPAAAVPSPNSATRDLSRAVPLANPATRDLDRLAPPGPTQGLRSGSQALQSGTRALREGKADDAANELAYGAPHGPASAISKLGRTAADAHGRRPDIL